MGFHARVPGPLDKFVIWKALVLATLCFTANASGSCREPLGMETGIIPDEAISASSAFDAKSVGPQNARIRQEKNGGAWCPRMVISHEVREFLEIDLNRDHRIAATETQGRFGNGQGQEYAEHFMLEYWRDSLGKWMLYRNSKGEKVLQGNSNTYLGVNQLLDPPIVASRVRFVPYSVHPRTICMRVEVYGCSWEEGILSYAAPIGEIRDPDVNLEDKTYDGVVDTGRIFGGLGQLTDNQYGEDDFRTDPKGLVKGDRWVGWQNYSREGQPVEITVEFDRVREFSSLHIHCNNMFTKGVQVFSTVFIYFSMEGERYQSTPVRLTPTVDLVSEAARNVTISLRNRVGRFIRLQLHHANRWLMLSEMAFESVPFHGNVTEELLTLYYQQDDPEPSSTGDTIRSRKELTQASSETSPAYIGLITGVLAVVAVLLGAAVVLMVRRSRRKELLHKHAALAGPIGERRASITMKELRMGRGSNGVVHQRCNLYGTVAGEESDSETSSVYHEPYKLLPNGKQEYGCLLKKDTLSSSKSGEYTDFTSINSFQDEVKFSPSFFAFPPPPPPSSRPPPYEPTPLTPLNKGASGTLTKGLTGTLSKGPSGTLSKGPSGTLSKGPSGTLNKSAGTETRQENYYAATDILKVNQPSGRTEQHLTPGQFTSFRVPEGALVAASGGSPPLAEFPRHRLRLVEKLGEGPVGLVQLCEAEGMAEYGGVPSFGKKLVIVKTLWRGITEATKQAFLTEARCLSALRDPHLARLLAACTREDPPAVISEYLDTGDLSQFLREHRHPDANGGTISYGCLIYIATQIASGMKYLESLDFVHRDLATRNCLMGKNFSIKITDYGMYRNQYSADYYISDTKALLPIRWMSWESLLLGKFSSKSDVWAFGVTLWELLTLAQHAPFGELTNEQVIANSSLWLQPEGQPRQLGRPAHCPKEIYDLLCECWRREESLRPRFSEIHLFLQRKNLGYVPGAP